MFRFINKLSKVIKKISVIFLSTLGVALVVLAGAFGYIFKDDSISLPFLNNLFGEGGVPQEIIDGLHSFENTANTIFIVCVVILSVFLGALILYLITLPFSRKKEKENKSNDENEK